MTAGCCLVPANDAHKRRERKQLLSSSTCLLILLRVRVVIHVRFTHRHPQFWSVERRCDHDIGIRIRSVFA